MLLLIDLKYMAIKNREEAGTMHGGDPVIYGDYPDPDVIRVQDTYYMITTTMHMFPGAQILRSYDLINWEHCSYVFQALGDHPSQMLKGGHIYGHGMWAGTLRYYKGLFHVLFICKDTELTYHFTSKKPQGPWQSRVVEGFYYDASLLFDDDGRVYIAHGNRQIRITELNDDLSGPKIGGLDRLAVCDSKEIMLGYEGAHLYKIKGYYYLFLIHWERGKPRTQACFRADSIEGEFIGGDILQRDFGFHGMGVAQGGVIDTPDGKWFLMLFQDRGAAGRMPVLLPFVWEDGFPKVADVLQQPENRSTRPGHIYTPLYASDSFRNSGLSSLWQWNHEPDPNSWALTPKGLRLTAGCIVNGLEEAPNTLTQRAMGLKCEMTVELDATNLNDGDYAGLCALQGCFAKVAVTKSRQALYLCFISREAKAAPYAIGPSQEPILERERILLGCAKVQIKACFDFENLADMVTFFFKEEAGEWRTIGKAHKLVYRLDHFMGCRGGLFCYATKQTGGYAVFKNFCYNVQSENVL